MYYSQRAYLLYILPGGVCTHLTRCAQFYYDCKQHSFTIKMIQKCKNGSKLAEVKVKYRRARCYGPLQCVYVTANCNRYTQKQFYHKKPLLIWKVCDTLFYFFWCKI